MPSLVVDSGRQQLHSDGFCLLPPVFANSILILSSSHALHSSRALLPLFLNQHRSWIDKESATNRERDARNEADLLFASAALAASRPPPPRAVIARCREEITSTSAGTSINRGGKGKRFLGAVPLDARGLDDDAPAGSAEHDPQRRRRRG